MKISAEKISYAVIFFMLFANLFDMGGVFGIKYLSYLAGIVYLFYNYHALRIRLEEVWVVFIMFALIPAWSLFKGIVSGGSMGEASSQVTPFIPGILFLFILSWKGKNKAIQYFFQILFALAVTSHVIFFLILLAPNNILSQTILQIMQEPGHGYFGLRGLAGFTIPNVYFKATLFFVAGFTYSLFLGKYFKALFFFSTLVICFSKAGILLCLVFLALYVILEAGPRVKWSAVALLAILVININSLGQTKVIAGYVDNIVNAVRGKALTTQIRVGHWNSFLDLVSDHPGYLLWGQGVGTSYYSLGRKSQVYNIELDHVDAVRQFGLIWLLFFSLIVVYLTLRFYKSPHKSDRALGMAFVSIYMAAGTNPVLITPIFMMLMASLYVKAQQDLPPLLGNRTSAAVFNAS